MSNSSSKSGRKSGTRETVDEPSDDGPARIEFQLRDLGGFAPANRAPWALNDFNGTDGVKEAGFAANGHTALPGDGTASGNVLVNDRDRDGDALMVASASGRNGQGVGEPIQGTYGHLVLNSDGTWLYTLNNDAPSTNALRHGEQAFEYFAYTVSDGKGGTDTATLRIKITGTNDAPIAEPDLAFVKEGASVSGDVALNDRDPDGARYTEGSDGAQDTLTYALDGPVAGLVLNADGTYTFDASNAAYQHIAAGEAMEVVAHYTVTDEHGASAASTLTITVVGAPEVPKLAEESFSLRDTEAQDSFKPITGQLDLSEGEQQTPGLSYSIVAGTSGTVQGDSVSVGLYGTLTVHNDGTYSYVPDARSINALQERLDGEANVLPYHDVFDIQVSNGTQSSISILTVSITGVNDRPTIEPVTRELAVILGDSALSPIVGQLVGSDVDSPSLAYTINGGESGVVAESTVLAGKYGTLTVYSDGRYNYTPDATSIEQEPPIEGYDEMFDVRVEDGSLADTKTLMVQISVAGDPITLVESGTETSSGMVAIMETYEVGASTSVPDIVAALGAALAGGSGGPPGSPVHTDGNGPLLDQTSGEFGASIADAALGVVDGEPDLGDLLTVLDDTSMCFGAQGQAQVARAGMAEGHSVAFDMAQSGEHSEPISILFEDQLPAVS